jgi:hypothetical protein
MTQIRKLEPEAALRTALWSVALIAATGALISGLIFGFRTLLGVAAGGTLATLNLWAITVVARGYMGKLNPNVPWALVGILKLMVLFAAVFALLKYGYVEPGALFVGYGALPLGIAGAQLGNRRTRLEHG